MCTRSRRKAPRTHTPHAQQAPPPVHPRVQQPVPAFIPSTEDVTKLLAEKDAIIAAKDKEIEELTKLLGNVKVKPGPKNVGLYGNADGTIVRAVHEGDGGGHFTLLPSGGKKYLKATDADNWVVMEEEEVNTRVAAHEAKMASLKGASPAK